MLVRSIGVRKKKKPKKGKREKAKISPPKERGEGKLWG